MYQNKDVLITGGAGFIGSNLAHELVGLGAKVTIIDALIPGYGGNRFNLEGIQDKVDFHIADVRSRTSTEELVKGKDYIFNLAGQISHIDSMQDPFTDLEINCTSQLTLLEACRKNNPTAKVVYTSTRQIYGKPEYLPVDETHPINPTDVNGINKMAGERYHTLYNDVHGIPTCSLRLTNTYGQRQLMEHNRQGFIPWFIRQAIEGEEIKLFGTGDQLRDMNHVDDVVNAILLAGKEEANGQVFNLGHFKPISLKEFTETLIEANGSGDYEIVPFPEEKKAIDIGSTYCRFEKIRKAIGWEPKIDLKEGLEKTIAFYREHKSHYY